MENVGYLNSDVILSIFNLILYIFSHILWNLLFHMIWYNIFLPRIKE